jgi:hypothetical protein
MLKWNSLALVLTLVAALLSGGCFRVVTGRGAIYYEAKSPYAKIELPARVPDVVDALSADARFVNRSQTTGFYFEGKEGGVFDGCSIGYREPTPNDPDIMIMVRCPHSIRFSKQAHDLRRLIKGILGKSLVAQLNVMYDEGLLDMR